MLNNSRRQAAGCHNLQGDYILFCAWKQFGCFTMREHGSKSRIFIRARIKEVFRHNNTQSLNYVSINDKGSICAGINRKLLAGKFWLFC